MEDEDVTRLQCVVEWLQGYPVDAERARQLGAELEGFRLLLRQQLAPLAFDDQPADFRSAQAREMRDV
jgi:hypothetical protein